MEKMWNLLVWGPVWNAPHISANTFSFIYLKNLKLGTWVIATEYPVLKTGNAANSN